MAQKETPPLESNSDRSDRNCDKTCISTISGSRVASFLSGYNELDFYS